MAKTVVEKVASPRPDISIFKISGTLGYHENDVLTRFFRECSRKNVSRLIMDFSSLTSLGGGCARIIRETAEQGMVAICVVGASRTVEEFLTKDGPPIMFVSSQEEALKEVSAAPVPKRTGEAANSASEQAGTSQKQQSPKSRAFASSDTAGGDGTPADDGGVILLTEESAAKASPAAKSETTMEGKRRATGEAGKDLQKKIVQYRALFSLNSDLNRLQDKSGVLDAFLLTTIAQVGVESAAFLERQGDVFRAVSWKGFETAGPDALNIEAEDVDLEAWRENPQVVALKNSPIGGESRMRLGEWGLPFVAPFIVNGDIRGVVLLGPSIREGSTDQAWEFMSMLISQAAIAYENSCRFEAESHRTLGLVHSLISMIEENTVSRGSTEVILNYVHTVAVGMHYPEEHLRELVYGTVLRDIGMIKVSDLIVRSPRELVKEEWDVIKQHPIEGAELLASMGFSKDTADIVRYHHERFNGEGYPEGLQGPQIPLGARIVSVVESYVAMLQDRPTRPALKPEEALNTLKENWGMRYDPDVIVTFTEISEEEIRTGRPVKYKGGDLFNI